MTALMLLLVAAFVLALVAMFAPNQWALCVAVLCLVVYMALLHLR